jgi:ribonuclease Z
LTFEVKILGSNSASFAFGRHHTSQLVNSNQNLFLVDCGEATQIQLLRHQVRYSRINHIFISHLHGDHYLGLIGLIFTNHLQGRSDDLHIYGPKGLDEIITIQLKYSDSRLCYNLHFHEINEENQLLFENEDIEVRPIKMDHRISCFGFIFKEKPRKFKLNREILPDSLSKENLLDLKDGKDIVDIQGKFWSNNQLANPPHLPRSYVYCADTRFHAEIRPQILNANLLYHEATFLNDMQARAETTFHSTAQEAARFAAIHNVRQLLIGHFSSRYFDVQPFLGEAKPEFENTLLAIEGQTFEVTPVQPIKVKENNVEIVNH